MTDTIPLSVDEPYGVVVSHDGRKVYVSSRASGAVAVLTVSSLTQTAGSGVESRE